MRKTTIATQDVMMFRKLRKVSVGTNQVKSVAAKLVQAKLAKEGVRRRDGSGGVLPLCWRDIAIVNKLLDIKVKECKRFEHEVKELLIKVLTAMNYVGSSVFRKIRKKLNEFRSRV